MILEVRHALLLCSNFIIIGELYNLACRTIPYSRCLVLVLVVGTAVRILIGRIVDWFCFSFD